MPNTNNTTTKTSRLSEWSIIGMSGVVLFHMLALSVFFTGVSPAALTVCAIFFVARGFGITGGYHRLFSHRAYQTSRPVQFLIALLGSLAGQGKIFWWVSHHRDHHKHSDQKEDLHSPHAHSFWFSHIGWLFTKRSLKDGASPTADLEKFPELRFLNRHYEVIMITQGVAVFMLGVWLSNFYNTSGIQVLAWGYFMSTTILLHVTFMVNSVCHVWGARPYNTTDQSRNNWLVGLLALGEGWHNNHHHCAYQTRMGLKWWQIDITYYILWTMKQLRLVWGFRAMQPAVSELPDTSVSTTNKSRKAA